MDFHKIDTTEDINIIKPYLDLYDKDFSDMTRPNFYMWRDIYPRYYYIFDDTLIIKEVSAKDENDFRFYMPIGKNPLKAFTLMEKYCLERHLPLIVSNLTLDEAEALSSHYHNTEIHFDRCWSDYVYISENMRTFKGKKFAGQRNHINKFKKLYGDYQYHTITPDNVNIAKNFLIDMAKKKEFSSEAERIEFNLDIELIDNMFDLDAVGGYVTCGERTISVAIGEKRKNTLYVCVEKADKEFAGAYQVMVQEFALHNTDDEVCYINREEDMGNEGLRTSKLQYQPIEIKNKYWVEIRTLFDKIATPVKICAENVVLNEITNDDKAEFMRLYLDDDNNKFWGYDYKEDAPAEAIAGNDADYFINFVENMKSTKEEYSLAVRIDDKFAGEAVFHNFDYFGNVEIGIRLLPEYQGLGIGTRAVKAMKQYAFNNLGAHSVKMKCFLQNERSANMIKNAGFIEESRDDKYNKFVSFS